MSILEAVIYGLLQGITGFLPVSSYGHLLLANSIGKLDAGGISPAFVMYMYAGALCTVLVLFAKDIWKMSSECLFMLRDIIENVFRFFCRLFGMKVRRKRIVNSEYRKFACMLMVSAVPTLLAGYFLIDVAELLADFPTICGVFMIGQAVILLIASKAATGNARPKDATYKDAFRMGLVQVVSCLPGFSRTGSTVTAALLYGFDKHFALRYSMIMSIPAIGGVLYLHRGEMAELAANTAYRTDAILAAVLCALAGFVAVRIMMAIIKKQRFLPWALYSAILGIIMIVTTR